MTPAAVDFEVLATYNAEVARGIVHTPEWDARMAALQREFDAQVAARLEAVRLPDGTVVLPPWWPADALDAAMRILHGRGRKDHRGERDG